MTTTDLRRGRRRRLGALVVVLAALGGDALVAQSPPQRGRARRLHATTVAPPPAETNNKAAPGEATSLPPLELSAAERARTTAEQGMAGGLALSTLDAAGAPWTEFAEYVLDASGGPVLLLQWGAAATKHLASTSVASVLVTTARGGVDSSALDRSRLTLRGSVRAVSGDEDAAALEAKFLVAHPHAEKLLAGDWALHRLERLSAVLLVDVALSGDQAATDVAPEDYAEATPDVVAKGAAALVAELNEAKHAGDRHAAAKQLLGVPDATAVSVLHVDQRGVDFRVDRPHAVQQYRLAYRLPPKSPDDAKSEINKLLQEAWEADNGVAFDGNYADKPRVVLKEE